MKALTDIITLKKFTLSQKQHNSLAKKCIEAGKIYLASVWDIGAFDWIDRHSKMYKIGSGDLTAYPIIREDYNDEKTYYFINEVFLILKKLVAQ